MSTLEVLASILTVICVALAVVRSTFQYPVGLVATGMFFFVFLHAHLFASTLLQVVFCAVQFYGWWFWLFGDHGHKPKIVRWRWQNLAVLAAAACLLGIIFSTTLNAMTSAKMALGDSLIFVLSCAAQFLLDRKVIQTWLLWAAVNALSIYVYGSQALWATTALYALLLLNSAWGYWEWRKELLGYGIPLKNEQSA